MSSTTLNPQQISDAGISQVSLHSSGAVEDWDKSLAEEVRHAPTANGTQNMGTRGRKSLNDLLRRHGKGGSLNLSDEEQEKLGEELGEWINSDSSPYELDDDKHLTGDETVPANETTVNGHHEESNPDTAPADA